MHGGFQVLIDEVDSIDPGQVTRLVLCSGKVYYNILERRREAGLRHVAIVRVEQLYPFPEEEIRAILKEYPKATEICWAQEEPRNQGSWFFMLSRRHLADASSASTSWTTPAATTRPPPPRATSTCTPASNGPWWKLRLASTSRRHAGRARENSRGDGAVTVDVKVPVLAESVPDATLLEWRKQPGDAVDKDEILIELETDKVVLEVPAPEAGVLAEILKHTGDTVLSREVLARSIRARPPRASPGVPLPRRRSASLRCPKPPRPPPQPAPDV